MGRKGRCEPLGAQVRSLHIHRSQTLESLKIPLARGQNTLLLRHLRSAVEVATPSDCRDPRGLLYASGIAGCGDYPDWGTALRPIS